MKFLSDVKLPRAPTNDLDASTKKYVDYKVNAVELTPGPKGEDGTQWYVLIRYSDDGLTFNKEDYFDWANFSWEAFTWAGFSNTPGDWIGVFVTDDPTQGNVFGNYTWKKIKGEKGNTGDSGTSMGASLPTAAVDYRGKIFTVLGGTNVEDKPYICLKEKNGTYSWKPITGFSW